MGTAVQTIAVPGAAGATRPGAVLRAVLVHDARTAGDLERHLADYLDALLAHGHAVAFAGPLDGWLGEHAQRAGAPCLHLPLPGVDPFAAAALARHARHHHADLIHGHSPRASLHAGLAGLLCRIPALASVHATDACAGSALARRTVAFTQDVRSALLEAGRDPLRIELVPLGVPDPGVVPAERSAGLRAELGLPADACTGVLAGPIAPAQGHELALQLLAALHRRPTLHFLVIGDDHCDFARWLRAEARVAGVGARLRFAGDGEPAALLPACDFLLAAAREGPSPHALLAAAAAGRPTVAVRAGCAGELLDDGGNGLLAEAGDDDALATAVLRLLDEPGLCAALGAQARERWQQQHTLSRMTGRMLALYRGFAAQRRLRDRAPGPPIHGSRSPA